MKMLQEYSFSEGCSQCDHIRRYNETKPGLAHMASCRQRIVDAMTNTPEGKAKLDQYEDRVNRALAARVPTDAPTETPTTTDATTTSPTTTRRVHFDTTAVPHDVEGAAVGAPP